MTFSQTELDEIVNKVQSNYNDIIDNFYSEFKKDETTLSQQAHESVIQKIVEYRDLYKKLCSTVLNLRDPFNSKEQEIAQQIYYKTQQDYENKRKDRIYYRGNCSAFYITIHDVIKRLEQEHSDQEIWRTTKLRELIKQYLYDSLRVINDYQESQDNPILFKHYQTNNPDYSLYYDACQQIIFGEVQYENPSEQNEVTPSLIRVMIELRLKWSMGISGYMVAGSPGNMSVFFDVYKLFTKEEKIALSVDIDIIRRIYAWGNIYIHTGVRTYAWLPGFAINLLNPLFYGESHRMGGIRVQSKDTIYEFWDKLKDESIKNYKNQEAKVDIQPYKLGFICTDDSYNPIDPTNHYAIFEKSLAKAHSGDQIQAGKEMKGILKEGIEKIGNLLYERVKQSYVHLREKEIRDRAYYLWLQREVPLWDADSDWYAAIEDDINS